MPPNKRAMDHSGVAGTGYSDIVFDEIVNLGHLNLVVDHVGGKIPICGYLFLPLGQLVELSQRQLSEVVEIQLKRNQVVVSLQRFGHHLQPVVVDSVVGHV